MSYGPFGRGRHPAGVRSFVIDADGGPHPLDAEVWYPATAALHGRDLEPASQDRYELFPGSPPTRQKALRDAGYYTVLSGKNHMGDLKRAFDKISRGKGPGFQEDWVEILQQRPKDKPFFCWFGSYDAHRPWTLNDKAPVYENDQVNVPPYVYDGPQTRKDLTGYYHEISRTDYYVGKLREELERQGVSDNTYIIYCSDNGRPFPRDKTRLYDSGIKTPLIVWAPGHLP